MLGLIANLLIRSAVIIGVGALLSRLAPRLRSAQRHAILFAAFLLLALWPMLAAVLPAINLPIVRISANSHATVTVQQFTLHRRPTASAAFKISPVLLWAAISVFALTPIFIAHLRLRSLVKQARLCEDAAWSSLLHELCAQLHLSREPTLLIHPEPLMPMVAGVFHTSIVLPRDCLSWTPLRRRVVLLHELAHASRRDLLSQLFARLLTAAWWFQPLSWFALSLLRNESERACDELVVAAGIRPSDYAAELLAIAQSFSARHKALMAGMAVARTNSLELRLRGLLETPKAAAPSSPFLAVALICLTALTFTASAVAPSTESQPLFPRGHIMKQTLFAGMLASAGLTAATIGGSLYDPSGAAVPNAKALLYDPDTNNKFETTSTADGKFAFEALPPGQYILRVQSPGFATLFREFNVKADARVDRGFALELGKVKETINIAAEGGPAGRAAPAVQQPPKRVRIGGAVEEANLTTKVQPVYPPSAKAARIHGTVELEMVVSKEGEPLDLRVLASPSDDLTQSALEAVRQWRYRPTLLNGAPVEVVTDVIVNYTLSN